MKAKIFMALFTLVLGGIAGYISQQWSDRAIPVVQITSISFDKIERENLLISIPNELQQKTKKSEWCSTLDESITYEKLVKLIKDDLSETVEALGNMTSDLPRLRKYVREHQYDISAEQAKQYREYFKQNIDKLSLTYLTMNIAGLIKRQEVELDILEGKSIEKSILPEGKKSLEEIKDSLDSRESEQAAIALRIVTEWHPIDLIKCLDIIIERVGEQATINREIKEQLLDLANRSSNDGANDYLSITVSMSNNGNKTISFQKYAVASLSGLNEPIFLETKLVKSGINLPQGSTNEIQLISRKPLPTDLSSKLRTMYDTDFIKCKITMRILTSTKFSDEWITSKSINLSSFNKKLESEYITNAPKIEIN